MPRSSKSSLTLSIHLLLCLPLLLSPLTFSCSAAFGSSLFPSILSTCPSHVSLLLIFSITVSSAPSSSLVFSFLILSLLLLPLILLNHAIFSTTPSHWSFIHSFGRWSIMEPFGQWSFTHPVGQWSIAE